MDKSLLSKLAKVEKICNNYIAPSNSKTVTNSEKINFVSNMYKEIGNLKNTETIEKVLDEIPKVSMQDMNIHFTNKEITAEKLLEYINRYDTDVPKDNINTVIGNIKTDSISDDENYESNESLFDSMVKYFSKTYTPVSNILYVPNYKFSYLPSDIYVENYFNAISEFMSMMNNYLYEDDTLRPDIQSLKNEITNPQLLDIFNSFTKKNNTELLQKSVLTTHYPYLVYILNFKTSSKTDNNIEKFNDIFINNMWSDFLQGSSSFFKRLSEEIISLYQEDYNNTLSENTTFILSKYLNTLPTINNIDDITLDNYNYLLFKIYVKYKNVDFTNKELHDDQLLLCKFNDEIRAVKNALLSIYTNVSSTKFIKYITGV